MKKVLLIVFLVVTIGVIYKTKSSDRVIIPAQSLRLRIVASSNNPKDYQIKMRVKDALTTKINEILTDATTVDDSKTIISENLDKLDATIANILNPLNISYKINWGQNYFPAKDYKGVIYEAGDYDSLVIKIGKGEGDNWWCVLFPPLCFLENQNTSDVEYRLFVTRIIEYFK